MNTPNTTSQTTPFPYLLLLIGLAQGLALWWLLDDKAWVRAPLLHTGATYAAFVVPLVAYCTHHVAGFSWRTRLWAVLCFGALFAGLGATASWSTLFPAELSQFFGDEFRGWQRAGYPRPTDGFGAAALAFVGTTLLVGFDFDAKRWVYTRLFDLAWRNGILLATAAAMVGLFWYVLGAGAALMGSIGIEAVTKLIAQPVFVSVSICWVGSAAFALGLTRASMTDTIRRFVLSMTAWLLPLVLLFVAMWAVSVPFTASAAGGKSGQSTGMLMGLVAAAIVFASSAFQDGQRTLVFSTWLDRITRWAWLSLVPAVLAVAWALAQRVQQHGFSEDRIWAAFLLLVLAVHVFGYAGSVANRRAWLRSIAKTNVIGACVFCLGLLALLSPVAHVQQVAVSLHLRHVTALHAARPQQGIKPDWNYLVGDTGRFGWQALKSMAEGGAAQTPSPWPVLWAAQAKHLRSGKSVSDLAEVTANSPSPPPPPTISTTDMLAQALPSYPQPNPLPPGFVAHALQVAASSTRATDDRLLHGCLAVQRTCQAWVGDLNADGAADVVVFETDRHGNIARGVLYSEVSGEWQWVGDLDTSSSLPDVPPAKLQNARAKAPAWNDLVVDGAVVRVSR